MATTSSTPASEAPLRIAHLSDVHLYPDMARTVWERTKQMVVADRPDLIIASGDFVQHPSPLSLALARCEMVQLARDAKAELFTIPGNHDVAIAGSLRLYPFTRAFERLFDVNADAWLARYMPTFSVFRDQGWFKRQLWRLKLYPLLLLQLMLVSPSRRHGHAWQLAPDSPLRQRLHLVGLDSNQSWFLAAGRVSDDQLARLSIDADALTSSTGLGGALLPRLLVVHHHPVPIPYTTEDLTSFEPFLVLREAGTLLAQAALNDVDLILHGHRHVRSLSRLSYAVRQRNLRHLNVLSASSPTASDIPATARSYNLVDIRRTGQMAVQERFTEHGGGSTPTTANGPEAVQDAVSHAEQKLRTFERARRTGLMEADDVVRTITIYPFGRTDHGLQVRQLRMSQQTLGEFRYPMRVGLGFIDPATVVMEPALCSAGVRRIHDDASRSREPATALELAATVPTAGTLGASDVAFTLQTLNSFRLSEWESVERGHDDDEFVAMPIRWPMRRLQLDLKLPDSQAEVEPYLECMRLRNYPDLVLNPERGMVDFEVDEAQLVFDAEATRAESTGLSRIARHTWRLVVEHPQLGYVYRLRWAVQDTREQRVDTGVAGETLALRQRLLERRARLLDPAASVALQKDLFSQLLSALLEEWRKVFASEHSAGESVRLCLLTYQRVDDGKGGTRPSVMAVQEVVSGPRADAIELKDYWLPLGEGAAGVAFKAADSHLYWALARHAPAPGGSPLFKRADALGLKAVLALPIYHPEIWDRIFRRQPDEIEGFKLPTLADMPSVHETVGILTFASDSPGSGLSQLHDAGESSAKKRRIVRELQDVAHLTAEGLFKQLT